MFVIVHDQLAKVALHGPSLSFTFCQSRTLTTSFLTHTRHVPQRLWGILPNNEILEPEARASTQTLISPVKSLVTQATTASKSPASGPRCGGQAPSSSSDDASSDDNLSQEQIAKKKLLKDKARKARNQRRYYQK